MLLTRRNEGLETILRKELRKLEQEKNEKYKPK